ncbi:putative very-long-chain 3-oxoacyl-CoA reductase [Helianthus annuus]|nr:putative very-long-chain 3-oxoacyl-CoA reductase [Helianthus annuus]KAJ0497355.1 putative very-long-chain 3-oxoacyl-CoA reductase [Helianthus annuus]KAJ0663369.1 putative very-long-chain 3-oxoacyl-CoA reductase [Helianthus annuus]
MGIISLITGWPGPSGFGSATTAEQVTEGIDASHLTVVITGGASGIGLETARVLALRGAHVIIAARNMEAANEAKQNIIKNNQNAKLDILQLDLSSLMSVKAFADNFLALNIPLNILINNAGIMFCPYQLSQDGIEMQFATNHLGHFYLTNLLLDKMKSTALATGIEGRIVNLSSVAHLRTYKEGIKFDTLNDKNSYSDKLAYGQSKLANLLHANELSRLLKEEGIMNLLTYVLWKNVPQGAATTCYVAVHPDMKGVSGKYYLDCNEWPASDFARDPKLAKKLWDYSNHLLDSVLQHTY